MEGVQPQDLVQDLRLAKRRQTELCRQKRIFNARNRIIGVRPQGKKSRGNVEGQAEDKRGGWRREEDMNPGNKTFGPGLVEED